MNEQKILRKYLLKHIRSNILMFICIFVIFGVFMFQLVNKITYDTVNIELRENIEIMKNVLKKIDTIQIDSKFSIINSENTILKSYNIITSITNPKIICIVRDEEGKIINTSLGNIDVVDFDFDDELIEKMYEIVLDDEYYYRGVTIDLSEITNNYKGYIQLLANVDTEKEMTHNYQRIIIWSVGFGIIISIFASIMMSKKNLEPIAIMLKKQNEFVQNVSHELRTPLTIIQAKQELLLSHPSEKIIENSEEIGVTLSETKRMSKIIKDLMLLARADNKQIVLQKEEVEIDEFIENIAKNYSEIIEVSDKKLITNLNYKKMIAIDTNKIYQVMVILLDNAIKYTEPGDSIEIVTSLKDNKCVIEVKDTGIGISDEAIKHIFERFYREDSARTRETGGSGLGLSIADMIITAHGGSIKASHNSNKGTVFAIKLPR